MNTLAPLISAEVVRHIPCCLSRLASAQAASPALSVVGLAAILLVVTFIAAMVRAARRIAELIHQLLQLAVTMMFFMFSGIIAVMVVTTLVVHR